MKLLLLLLKKEKEGIMGYMNKAYNEYDRLTSEYMEAKSIKEIKENSIYFTPKDMADCLLEDVIITKKDNVKILDTSCGNGILILKLIDKILNHYVPKEIVIYAFDIDSVLIDNINYILSQIPFKNKSINVDIKLYCENFLYSNLKVKFDYIVMNPPYKKINISEVPLGLRGIITGQPNLYHLFILKALENLDEKGRLCILSPKNYLSGKYTEKLRKKLMTEYSVNRIHTFNNRRTFFDIKITQEVCIVHIMAHKVNDVKVSYNGNNPMKLPLNHLILNSKTNIIQTPRNIYDYNLINKFKKFPQGVIGDSILMKTGKVVQFRVKNENLSEERFEDIREGVPLIVYRHISSGKLIYNQLTEKIKNKAISIYHNDSTKSLLIDNKNYVILRKNTDKNYEKLISCISYIQNLETNKLGIDNGLAYLTNHDNSLTELEVKGIHCILMSKQFDDYYRMINSTHTLNVYEFENIHFPDIQTIKNIGMDLGDSTVTVELATIIMDEYL